MKFTNPIEADSFQIVGRDLARPEYVLATREGDLFVSHRGAGITQIRSNRQQVTIGSHAQIEGHDFLPNGFCMLPDGNFLVANVGEAGGVWRLNRQGSLDPWLREVDGVPLSAANFILRDEIGRIWITVSTRTLPRFLSYRPNYADGFIVLVDEKGARIVADKLSFTNEVRLGEGGSALYVSETFGRRVSRYSIAGGALKSRSNFAEFGHGSFPDGIAFDAEGALWVTSIVSNRLYRISPGGQVAIVLEDSDPAHVERVESALHQGNMGREHFYSMVSEKLMNISSIAFGGADLRTVFLGSLMADHIVSFRSKVAGAPMSHWV